MVGVTRPGHALAQHLPHGAVTLLEIPSLDVSSTMCRERLPRGQPIDFLVPAPVVDYIRKQHLYR